MARGANLNTVKVELEDKNDFTETLEYQVLHCNNFSGNNNKFYCIEIQQNPVTGQLRLFSHYGRLGKTNTYEIRDTWKRTGKPVEAGEKIQIEDEYRAIISKKEAGKTVDRDGKSIHEHYTKVDVLTPKVGSLNIRNQATVNIKKMAEIESSSDPIVAALLNQLKVDNIHEITSKTSFKFTSTGLETDIGPVSEIHILKAKGVLDQIADLIRIQEKAIVDSRSLLSRVSSKLSKRPEVVTPNGFSQDMIDKNNHYFSLIPHKFHGKLKAEDMITTPDNLSKEQDLLNDLLSAVQLGLSQDDGVNEEKLKVDLKVMDKNKTWKEIEHYFNTTRHAHHGHLKGWKICRIFEVSEKAEKIKDYEATKAKLGNEMQLFHGSRNSNILSILLNGLMVPPRSAGFVNGRMFGDGIYGADCSTKALNYATGYWGGRKDHNKVYVFVTRFAMGKMQKCKTQQNYGADPGFDSVHGLSDRHGGALINDEYIVYDTRQAIITHLLELTQ